MLLDAHERLNAAGVSLQSATEPLDTSQPIGRFLMHLLASVDELEHGTIVERTNLVRGRAAQEGRWGGGLPPYGYRVTGEKHDRRLVVYKPEAGVVRRIFVLYTGGLGLGSLANLLNAEGVPALLRRAERPEDPQALAGHAALESRRAVAHPAQPSLRWALRPPAGAEAGAGGERLPAHCG